MKKIGIMLAALVLCAISASATRISKSKAQAKAVSFFQKGLVKANGAEVKLAKEYASSAEAPAAVFAFSRGENVVFVSAEDKMPAILGYSSNADVNNLPPALEDMLRYYAHLTDAVREGRIEAPKLYASETAVDSLLHTWWYQEAPFWDLCPTYKGERTPNGCVSTAFAQVMKYYNWPVNPTGTTPAYTTKDTGIEISSEDLSTRTYKWDEMIPIYKGGEYTEEQGQAVAQLCYDLGVASKMDYDPKGSGTYYGLAAEAVRTNFGYNKGLHIDYADLHTEEEWVAKLKNELNQGRPLPYDGQTNTMQHDGHCFVIDGYDKDGRFHVNWGWGGRSNGNFLITSLLPKEQGVGGSASGQGFSMRQRTLFDFVPDREGTSTAVEEYFFRYENCENIGGDNIKIKMINNWGITDFYGDINMQLVDKDGNVIGQQTVMKDYHCRIDLDQEVTVSLKDFDFSGFDDGKYNIDFTFVSSATNKEYQAIHTKQNCRVAVENGKLKAILNCAILEGKILSCEVTEYDGLILSLNVLSQFTNVDDITFEKDDEVRIFVMCYCPEASKSDSGYGHKNASIMPGESITYEASFDLSLLFLQNVLDRVMVRVQLYYPNGDLETRDYPLKDLVATGIDKIINKVEGKSPAFSLDGKRVSDDYKGVVIKDKKKTLNK